MRKLSFLLLLCGALASSSCGLLPESEPEYVRTTRTNTDGSVTVMETPYVDPQKAAHAEATINLFSE